MRMLSIDSNLRWKHIIDFMISSSRIQISRARSRKHNFKHQNLDKYIEKSVTYPALLCKG